MNKEVKNCQNCKQNFTIEPEDFEFYAKIKVPAPTFCPECRFQRRLGWVNLRTLYRRPDFHDSDKTLISMYAPEKPLVIWEDKKWWADDFDPLNYGINYDFSRPFFEQFGEFLKHVPLPHLQREYTTGINSEYCNGFANIKNCHLAFALDNSEDCLYAYTLEKSKDCCDISFSTQDELCYEVLNVRESNRVLFSHDCEACHDVAFCRDCIGCMHCFGCANLKNKQYCIFNQQYSKEEYQEKIKEFKISSYSNLIKAQEKAEEVFKNNPYRSYHGRRNNNISGDYVYNSKNTHDAYIVDGCEDVRYAHFLRSLGATSGTTSSYDYSIFGVNSDLIYESAWVGIGCSNIKFSLWNYGSRDLEYCIGCHSSSDLFGCVGVRKGSYCIFNKQYSKEDYFALKEKIIQHMKNVQYADKQGKVYGYGEFFPLEISPFAYNETVARDLSPLPKEKVLELGYKWREMEDRNLEHDISWKDLPDDISKTGDDILGKMILCKAWEEDSDLASQHNCTKVFKLTAQELNLYRRLKVPLPRYCPNSRYNIRIKGVKPFVSYERKCQCLGNEAEKEVYKNGVVHSHGDQPCLNKFKTVYDPTDSEIVYCEQCYNQEVA